MFFSRLAGAACLSFLLTACDSSEQAAEYAATIKNAASGAYLLGDEMHEKTGESLTRADMAAYGEAAQKALKTGVTRSWNNPDTGHHGTVFPHARFQDDEGAQCSEYTQVIYIDGARYKTEGEGCLEDDGNWHVTE